MGVPVSLSHTKYPRNALLFNLAFVVDGKFECLQEYFSSIEQALMKLAGYLTTLERESEYLFTHGNFDAFQPAGSSSMPDIVNERSSKSRTAATGLSHSLAASIDLDNKLALPLVMVELHDAINATLSATVNVGRGNTMYLKLYPDRSAPEDVLLHQVPVPVISTNFTADALGGILAMWSPVRAASALASSVSAATLVTSSSALSPFSAASSSSMIPSSSIASSMDLSASTASSDPGESVSPSTEAVRAPSPVQPVTTAERFSFLDEWDLALRRVIPFIDGVSHVKKICRSAQMDLPAVSKALQHLLYFGCIKMLDIFQFSNIYTCLPTLRNLYSDTVLQRACADTVAIDPSKPVDFQAVFALYAQCQPDTTVRDLVLKSNLEEHNIDVRAFIHFGLLNGILRRIHKYPVSIAANSSSVSSIIHNVHQMIDGKHSYDEIAVAHDLPFSELDKHFDLSLFR